MSLPPPYMHSLTCISLSKALYYYLFLHWVDPTTEIGSWAVCGSRFESAGYPPPHMTAPNIQWTTTSISAVPWTWPSMEVPQMQLTAASMQSIASYQQSSHSWPDCLKSTIPLSLASKDDLYSNYNGCLYLPSVPCLLIACTALFHQLRPF